MKLCECGCGKPAPIATKTSTARGHAKGQPHRFRVGHAGRKRKRWAEKDCGYLTPCWIWQLAISGSTGYGNSANRPAHIVVWESLNGPVPTGHQLDHLCRTRACVRPDHLEPVTCAENVRRGDRTKLKKAEVLEIRSLAEGGWLQSDIAVAYGVSQVTISNIHTRHSWADLQKEPA